MKSDQFSCKTLWASLSDYIDGELSEELCQRIEQHMAGCEHCRVVVDTTHKTILLYHDTVHETEVPDDVRLRLVETLHLEDFLKPKPSSTDF
jgi:anti-sigma factor (TIGR02949 family)